MAEDQPSLGLIEPFAIDSGELDGIDSQNCFCLGVEWEMFRQKLKALPDNEGFKDLCYEANARRLSDLAERHKRFVDFTPAQDGWVTIIVGTKR